MPYQQTSKWWHIFGAAARTEPDDRESPTDAYAFGPFVFDMRRRTLRRDGSPIALPPKAAEMLALLLERAGEPIAKEQFYASLWPDKIVEDANLTQTVYILRRVLGSNGVASTMIRTIPQVGYAFVDPVAPVVPSASAPRLRALPVTVAIVALLSGTAALGFILVARRPAPTNQAWLPSPVLKTYQLARLNWSLPTRSGALRSIRLYDKVVKAAPSSPLGYAGLSDAYHWLAQTDGTPAAQARDIRTGFAYAQKAVALGPNSSEAHASYAQALSFSMADDEYRRAPGEFERAIALDPQNPLAHRWYGAYAFGEGNFKKAQSELNYANALEPLSAQDMYWLGISYYYGRSYDPAVKAIREAIALGARGPIAKIQLALALDRDAQPAAAQRELDAALAQGYNRPEIEAVRVLMLVHDGRRDEAQRRMLVLARDKNVGKAGAISVAAAWAALGRVATARAWLRKHSASWDPASVFPQYDPRLDAVRSQIMPKRAPPKTA